MDMGGHFCGGEGLIFLASRAAQIRGGNAQRSPGSDVDDHAGVGRHVVVGSAFGTIVSRI